MAEPAPPHVTIVLIGASHVGKSALVAALGGVLVTDDAGFPSTVGIDRHQAHLPASLLGDVGEELGGVDVEVCDVGGREGLRDLPPSLRAQGMLLCYDLTQPSTFAFAGRWLRFLRASLGARYHRPGDDAPGPGRVVLVGTKRDLPGARLPAEAADFVAGQRLVCALETSAKTGENVQEAFAHLVRAILTAQRAPAHAGADQEKPDLFGEDPLVDVLQFGGSAGYEILLAPKPLSVCLASGFGHRTVHLYVLDPDRRALLVQRKVAYHRKFPGAWAPATGEVLREHSTDAARAVAARQLGLAELGDPDTDPPLVDARRPPELELLSTVLFTAPLSGTTAKLVRGDGPLTEVADIYLVEVCVAAEAAAPPDALRVQLDPAEATEARLVPYADVLERLRTDPTYIKPSDAYLRALQRGVEKRWSNPLHGL